MKTVRITRQGFSNHGMHSWMRYFIFVLSKKYNVLVDTVNPDLVIHSNIHYDVSAEDTFTKKLPTDYRPERDPNKKFLYVSGEVSDFIPKLVNENQWAMGYEKGDHPRYLRAPSCIFDVWTIFDECRLTDDPIDWLRLPRKWQEGKKFCCITQASDNKFRGDVFDKLNYYRKVDSSGPWRQNLFGEATLDKYQWLKEEYIGRNDGLTYREKIEFFRKYKFNISIHYTDTDYIVQEKIYHAFFANCVPIFYGNKHILEEGFNPHAFINIHNDANWIDTVIEADINDSLYRKYLREPIFSGNRLPDYFDFDYILSFLEKIVEA